MNSLFLDRSPQNIFKDPHTLVPFLTRVQEVMGWVSSTFIPGPKFEHVAGMVEALTWPQVYVRPGKLVTLVILEMKPNYHTDKPTCKSWVLRNYRSTIAK